MPQTMMVLIDSMATAITAEPTGTSELKAASEIEKRKTKPPTETPIEIEEPTAMVTDKTTIVTTDGTNQEMTMRREERPRYNGKQVCQI